jgi:hypothetical protein
MSLQRVGEIYGHKMILPGIIRTVPSYGWKVFRGLSPGLGGAYKSCRTIRPVNRWLNEKDFRDRCEKSQRVIIGADGNKYRIGWHVFLQKSDARKAKSMELETYTVRKVKIRDVVGVGYQGGIVVVAKRILIMRKK